MREIRARTQLTCFVAAAFLASLPTYPCAYAPAAIPVGAVRVLGPYVNVQYGFRFSAPAGLQVRRLAAPAPNHGATIDIGRARHIEVSAAFDAPGYGSTEALMSARLSEGDVEHLRRAPARMGGRPAEQAEFVSGGATHYLIVRQDGPVDDAINYTAELVSTPRETRSDRARFQRLLASFRFIPRK